MIKIWTPSDGICICTFQPLYQTIKSLACSQSKRFLCTVGTDTQRREAILLWDFDSIMIKKKPELIAKQISEFDVITIKFSPIDFTQLISCGRENIRFWRVKTDHLKGGPVVLNHHARNTVFTVLDFDFLASDPTVHLQSAKPKRVFVGSKAGMLYQVNYLTKDLEAIYKVHESSICSLSLSAGFCVSGSEDCFLRVWPLDFSEFILEAKHESIVISLDIAIDGLKLACGIANGGLGVLDLGNQSYKTVMRSHTEEISQLEYHEFSKNLISLSNDLTIRLW